ncbi:MAG: hypothetical protein AAGF12_00010 [Myxococcota bacterium]
MQRKRAPELLTGCFLWAALLLFGCVGTSKEPGSPPSNEPPPNGLDPDTPPQDLTACEEESWPVFVAMSRDCGGCHGENTAVPFAVDVASFEALIANDSRFFVPGEPDASGLIALLEGTAEGVYRQMPPGQLNYQELEGMGQTTTSMATIRSWITSHTPCEGTGSAAPPHARRVATHALIASIAVHLGFEAEAIADDRDWGVHEPLDSPGRGDAVARWRALGGAHHLEGIGESIEPGSEFMQNYVPLSQAWCRRAVSARSSALFGGRDPRELGSADDPAVRDLIRDWYLHFLGVQATEADVDRTIAGVFSPYEAREDREIAWTAVCSAFLRHPLYLTY